MATLISIVLLIAGAAAIAGSIYYQMLQKHQPVPARAERKPVLTAAMKQRQDLMLEVDRLRAECLADTQNPALRHELGAALLRLGDGSRAVIELKQAVTMNRRPAYLNTLGLAYMSIHDMASAQDAFLNARMLDPHSSEVWHNLARAMRMAGHPEQAEAELTALLEMFPDHVDSQVELAYCMQAMHQMTEAVTYLDKHVSYSPHVASYRLALIQVLCEQGHLPDARPHLQWLQERGNTVKIDALDGDVRVSVNGRALYEGLVA